MLSAQILIRYVTKLYLTCFTSNSNVSNNIWGQWDNKEKKFPPFCVSDESSLSVIFYNLKPVMITKEMANVYEVLSSYYLNNVR